MGTVRLLAGRELPEKNKMKKSELVEKLTELILEVPMGSCIVELGTYHGKSALFYYKLVGNKIDIFTIDDFDLEREDWLGQELKPEDENIFYENVTGANAKIKVCRMKIEDAVKRWTRSIGFLLWDVGEADRLKEDLEAWSKFIIPNGVVVVKDMPKNIFHTFEVIEELIESESWERLYHLNGVSFLRRLK